MSTEDSILKELSFLRNTNEEDPFEALCKACEFEWTTMKCKKGNPIERICVDNQCQNTIFDCGMKACQDCYPLHKLCKTVQVVAFVDMLNSMTDYQKKFFKKLFKIDDEIIQEINQSRVALAKTISQGSLDQQFIDILNIITGKKQIQNFVGKEADKLYNRLKQKLKEDNQNEDSLEKIFSERSHFYAKENIKLKTIIFDHFLKGSVPNMQPLDEKPFLESPLLTVCLNELYVNTAEFYKNKTYQKYGYLQKFDTEKAKFDKQNLTYLQSSFRNPKRSQLLFRASQHNFLAQEFHKACDGRSKTLTIIRTEFRKTIFAYASMAWHSNGAYVNDTTGQSCIVLLHPRNKFTLKNAGNSIYGNSTYGPTFGGHDIYIPNGAKQQFSTQL